METINIHGKQYETVASRIVRFRESYPDFSIITDLLSADADCVVMKASILNAVGMCISTGHAEEYRTASKINKTSALENCETSAVGRALAFFEYAGSGIASADEVTNAIKAQDALEELGI